MIPLKIPVKLFLICFSEFKMKNDKIVSLYLKMASSENGQYFNPKDTVNKIENKLLNQIGMLSTFMTGIIFIFYFCMIFIVFEKHIHAMLFLLIFLLCATYLTLFYIVKFTFKKLKPVHYFKEKNCSFIIW